MPRKYHIDVQVAPNRYPLIGRSGIVDWGEGCLKCAKCVKYQCVYNAYRERSFSPEILGDTIDQYCKNCFRCVQGCPRRLIHKTINPEWENLGDDVFTPEIVSATWNQAESGKIPVSGAGYGGPFAGAGFDSMWTDMSEIVRPTRDGIHGREYISTVVDIGRRPPKLEFDASGTLLTQPWPFIRLPIPILFNVFPFGDLSPAVWKAAAKAAADLHTLMVVPEAQARELAPEFARHLVPLLDGPTVDPEWIKAFHMVQIHDSDTALNTMEKLKATKPGMLVSVRTSSAIRPDYEQRSVELARAGVDLIHYAADERGYGAGDASVPHISTVIRNIHAAILDAGLRDEATLMTSGGLAMAEHVIKAMLCGANAVAVDVPLLVALQCRVCRNCREGGDCPVDIAGVDPSWASHRMVNLMAAWHNQLLEMMGAMGIREARRLRGEQGRVLFMEDLERDTFAKLFSQGNS
jgi:ferredoxin